MKGRRINKFEKDERENAEEQKINNTGQGKINNAGCGQINVWLWIWGEGGNQKNKKKCR